MADNWILALDNNDARIEKIQRILHKHQIYVNMAHSVDEAVEALYERTYALIIIVEEYFITEANIKRLRAFCDVPILLETKSALETMPVTEFALRAARKYALSFQLALDKLDDTFLDGAFQKHEIMSYSPYFILVDRRKFFVRGKEITVTKKEFELLYYLVTNKGIVLSYDQIYERVWNEAAYEGSTACVSALIKRIRKNVRSVYPDVPNYIKNVRGIGYCFDP